MITHAEREGARAEGARKRIDRVTVALREAQARGEVAIACKPEQVAHFLVAALAGAMLASSRTRDVSVVKRCVSELDRYLGLYEVRS